MPVVCLEWAILASGMVLQIPACTRRNLLVPREAPRNVLVRGRFASLMDMLVQ